MSRIRRRTAGALGVLGALTAATLLAGCGVDLAGSAAVVGDQRVTETQLADAVSQVRAEAGPAAFDPAKASHENVTRLTRQLLVGDAVAREGIVVTPSQVDALLAATAQSSGGHDKLAAALLAQDSVPASAVPAYALTFLQQQELGKKLAPTTADGGQQAVGAYLSKLSAELDVQISPRYGTWDLTTLGLGAPPTDLAAPAGGVAPSASPPATP